MLEGRDRNDHENVSQGSRMYSTEIYKTGKRSYQYMVLWHLDVHIFKKENKPLLYAIIPASYNSKMSIPGGIRN